MATILAHITVRDGKEAAFEEVAKALYEASHANETALLRYEYWRGAEPRTYYTLLSFDSHRGFIEHQTSDHHEDASAALAELIEGLRLEWVDPVAGASSLPPTDHQTAPEDADALTREYTVRFAAEVAQWWGARR